MQFEPSSLLYCIYKELHKAKDWLTDMLHQCDQRPILVKIIAFGFCIRIIHSVTSAVSLLHSFLPPMIYRVYV